MQALASAIGGKMTSIAMYAMCVVSMTVCRWVSALPALSAFSSYPTSASVAYFHVQCTQHEDE